PVHAATHSCDGIAGGKRAVSVRPGFAHSRRWRAARGHAVVEIYREPVSHVGGESFARREALRISHRLSRLCAQFARTASAESKLGRLRLRQPDSCASDLVGLRNWRSDLPGAVFARGVVDQFPQKRTLWVRLSGHGVAFSLGALGTGSPHCLSDTGDVTVAADRKSGV